MYDCGGSAAVAADPVVDVLMNDLLVGAGGFINGPGPKIPGSRRAAHTWLCDGGHKTLFSGRRRCRPPWPPQPPPPPPPRQPRCIRPAIYGPGRRPFAAAAADVARSPGGGTSRARRAARPRRDARDVAGSPRNRPKSVVFLRATTTERFFCLRLFLRPCAGDWRCVYIRPRRTFNDPIWGEPRAYGRGFSRYFYDHRRRVYPPDARDGRAGEFAIKIYEDRWTAGEWAVGHPGGSRSAVGEHCCGSADSDGPLIEGLNTC